MPYWQAPDSPVVANLCRTGYWDGEEPRQPVCPCCGQAADTFYVVSKTLDIVGCTGCIRKADAYEYFDSSNGD